VDTDNFNGGGAEGNVVIIAARPNYSNADPSGYTSFDGIKIKALGGTVGTPHTSVPEPATLALFTAGLVAVGFARRKTSGQTITPA
jgi:hypothetical protein